MLCWAIIILLQAEPGLRSLLVSCFILTACTLTQSQTTKTTHTAHSQHRPSRTLGENAGPKLPANVPPAPGKLETAYALRYIDTYLGTGASAEPGQFYTVHYTGWLASDGTKFDSSVDRREPFTFQQGTHRVIAGWDTGFAGMHVGGKRRLFIPYQLAYGEQGRPPVMPPKSDLIFDIELISAAATPPEAPAPAPPATPPGGSH